MAIKRQQLLSRRKTEIEIKDQFSLVYRHIYLFYSLHLFGCFKKEKLSPKKMRSLKIKINQNLKLTYVKTNVRIKNESLV